eukprot:3852304-Rhodomonas_salina.1
MGSMTSSKYTDPVSCSGTNGVEVSSGAGSSSLTWCSPGVGGTETGGSGCGDGCGAVFIPPLGSCSVACSCRFEGAGICGSFVSGSTVKSRV